MQFNLIVHSYLSVFLSFLSCICIELNAEELKQAGIPLYYWHEKNKFINFGDHLSLKLVERVVNGPVQVRQKRINPSKTDIKLLAIGSVIAAAGDGDVIWGSGINGKSLIGNKYHFTSLDVRAVRGPLTRQFLFDHFRIECPQVYGDPALLLPYFFPEFKKAEDPTYSYIIIPHYSEEKRFPKEIFGDHVVYPTEAWDVVIKKILNSQFVISSSLHGIIVAEAYYIPARLLKITNNEPLFKYQDYYFGTNRPYFEYATTVEEALKMGGEPPFECDLERLYQAFPFEFWPNTNFKQKIGISYEGSSL